MDVADVHDIEMLNCDVISITGTCIVYGNEDTCEFLPNFNCTVKITGTYGFNIYNPDILDQVSILNMAEFTELCRYMSFHMNASFSG